MPRELVHEKPMACPEQRCRGTMRRRYVQARGWVYICDRRGCNANLGCHPDGSPVGIPADRRTRRLRRRAHESLDELWKRHGMRRQAVYRWISQRLGHETQVHIGYADARTCLRVIRECRRLLRQLRQLKGEVE